MKFQNPHRRLLVIFYRNPILGNVKTRLANTLGEAAALAVYWRLVNHTLECTAHLPVDKVVCYSDFIDTEDNWPGEAYGKSLQQGQDLGERMMRAFAEGFAKGYSSICIIGTDCFELTPPILQEAFDTLLTRNAVIGPANDGGYYLLGMNSLIEEVFINKKWSTPTVFSDTLEDFSKKKINFYQLENLNDVDEEKDLPLSIRKLLELL